MEPCETRARIEIPLRVFWPPRTVHFAIDVMQFVFQASGTRKEGGIAPRALIRPPMF